jgi:hypothetical protein
MKSDKIKKYRLIIIGLVVLMIYNNYMASKQEIEFNENMLSRNYHDSLINIESYIEDLKAIKYDSEDVGTFIPIYKDTPTAAMLYAYEFVRNMEGYNANTYKKRIDTLSAFSWNLYDLTVRIKMLNTCLSNCYELNGNQISESVNGIVLNTDGIINELVELDELIQASSGKFKDLDLIDEIDELNVVFKEINHKNASLVRLLEEKCYKDIGR